jgi:hypothetical protein
MTQTNNADAEEVAARLRPAFESADVAAFGEVLDENVRWGGEDETPETCHTRAQVLERLAKQRAAGMRTQVLEVVPGAEAVLVGFDVKWPVSEGFTRQRTVYQVMKVRDRHVVDIRGYGSRAEAAAQAGLGAPPDRAIEARQLVPILNVSNLADSFEWFAKLGWRKNWDWSESAGSPTFGAVASGECEIFLCLDGQGGRGHVHGTWLSIWVDDVDTLHDVCKRDAIEVLQPPRYEPWGVREMHIRHPDGHVFRMTQPAPHHHWVVARGMNKS